MRGKGFPDQVAPYNPEREILEAKQVISHKIAILRSHHVKPKPGLGVMLKSFYLKNWKWIISMIIGLSIVLIRIVGG